MKPHSRRAFDHVMQELLRLRVQFVGVALAKQVAIHGDVPSEIVFPSRANPTAIVDTGVHRRQILNAIAMLIAAQELARNRSGSQRIEFPQAD